MVSAITLVMVVALAHGGCTMPRCGTLADCSCLVYPATTARCRNPSNCKGVVRSSCTSANGCEWGDYKVGCWDKYFCEGLVGAECTSKGCTWDDTSPHFCDPIECNFRVTETQCKATSNGCVWQSNFCGGPDESDCEILDTQERCVKENTGCEWDLGRNRCGPASDLNCQDNDTHTGCAAGSAVGCWWRPGYCSYPSDFNPSVMNPCYSILDKDVCNAHPSKLCEWSTGGWCHSDSCQDNDEGTGCKDGSPSYCTWDEDGGECDELDLYCQTTADGTGCTTASDPFCALQSATVDTCSGYVKDCAPLPEYYCLEVMCVWNDHDGDDDDDDNDIDAALRVPYPFAALAVALLMVLNFVL